MQKTDPDQSSVRQLLIEQTTAMMRYAYETGLQVPNWVMPAVEGFPAAGRTVGDGEGGPPATKDRLGVLSRAHNELARLVAPATPCAILFLETEGSTRFRFLGPITLIRRMMLVAILLLAVFIAIPITGKVELQDDDLFALGGLTLFVTLLFFLSAAGIGAAFEALYRANRYVVRGRFDPKYYSSYWVRFVLGLVAGLILASLIPVTDSGLGQILARPLLALIGGFSSAVLYRILTRLADTLEALFQGRTEDIVAAQQEVERARLANEEAQRRTRLVAPILRLQEELKGSRTAEAAKSAEEILRLVTSDEPAAGEPEGDDA